MRRRLELSRVLDTLPGRLTLARQRKLPRQDVLLLVPAPGFAHIGQFRDGD